MHEWKRFKVLRNSLPCEMLLCCLRWYLLCLSHGCTAGRQILQCQPRSFPLLGMYMRTSKFLDRDLVVVQKGGREYLCCCTTITFVITPNSCILAIVQFVCLHPCDLKTAAADSLQTHRTTTHSVSLWTLRYPPAHVQDVSYSIVTFQSTENGQNWSCFLQRQ